MRNVFPVITYKERKIKMEQVWVWSLIGELRSDMPSAWKKKKKKKGKQNIKQKQYCNKFNKDLKNCPH